MIKTYTGGMIKAVMLSLYGAQLAHRLISLKTFENWIVVSNFIGKELH